MPRRSWCDFSTDKHRTEDLFLRQTGGGGDVDKDRRLDEVAALVVQGSDIAATQQPTFASANLQVVLHSIEGGLVDDWPKRHVLGWLAYRDRLDPVAQPIAEDVVDAVVHNRSRAGGTFLATEAEGAGHDAIDGGVQIAVSVHDNGILAAHLKDGSLDEGSVRLGFAARSWISSPTFLDPVNAMKRVCG